MSIEIGTEEKASAVGKNNVHLQNNLHCRKFVIELQNVQHVYKFKYLFISVGALDRKGLQTVFEDGS